MALRQNVRLTSIDAQGKKHRTTIVVAGRTKEELERRVNNLIERQTRKGATVQI